MTDLKKGDNVILNGLPPYFFNELPEEDRAAVHAAIGKRVKFVGVSDLGLLELEFRAADRSYHTVWVESEYVSPIDSTRGKGE